MFVVCFILLILAVLLLIAYVLLLRNKLKQTSRNLKELIKENDHQQSNPQATSGDIYFKIDRDFVITFISESGADVLGYTPNELIGKPVLGTLFEDKKGNK